MTRWRYDPRTGGLRRARLWYGYVCLHGARQPLYLTRTGDLTLDRGRAHEFDDPDVCHRMLRDQMRLARYASCHVEEC
ncbi:hypothetical protein D3C71_1181100 [compost metagenome]